MRMIFIILLPVLLVIGCSSNSSNKDKSEDAEQVTIDKNMANVTSESTDKNKAADKNNEKVEAVTTKKKSGTGEESSSEPSEVTDENKNKNKKQQTMKDKYIEKLDNLNEELEPLKRKSENGSQAEMTEAEDELYERWDVALNEVYDALQTELSDKDMEALRIEQKKWIKKRDKHAEKQAAESKGGSLYSYVLTEAKKEFTKERCYGLVKDYMD